jgi:hypothetical protein
MTGAQRYNARMERLMDSCRDAKTRFNASSRTETDNTPATTGDVSNHSRVSDVVPSPENVSQGEIERLRAINAQLIAALDQIRYIARNHWLDHRVTYPAIAEQFATITEAVNRALNAAEKEF